MEYLLPEISYATTERHECRVSIPGPPWRMKSYLITLRSPLGISQTFPCATDPYTLSSFIFIGCLTVQIPENYRLVTLSYSSKELIRYLQTNTPVFNSTLKLLLKAIKTKGCLVMRNFCSSGQLMLTEKRSLNCLKEWSISKDRVRLMFGKCGTTISICIYVT